MVLKNFIYSRKTVPNVKRKIINFSCFVALIIIIMKITKLNFFSFDTNYKAKYLLTTIRLKLLVNILFHSPKLQ